MAKRRAVTLVLDDVEKVALASPPRKHGARRFGSAARRPPPRSARRWEPSPRGVPHALEPADDGQGSDRPQMSSPG